MSIRPATVDDSAAIHAMVVAIAEHVGATDKVMSTVADIAAAGFGAAPAFEVLIAEDDGTVVGMSLFFTSFSTLRGRRGAYVQDFYVAPVARASGLAARLLAATAAHVRATGGSYVRLSVDVANESAQRFYVRNQMRAATDEQVFVLDGTAFEAVADSAADSVADSAAPEPTDRLAR